MKILKINGAFGEGGGQIIRSAVTLSCITKKPIQIDNIRRNRKIPGLRAQHLAGIKILAKLCNATTNGLEVGSTSIKFIPKNVRDNELAENIGTAGSIPLVFQVIIPAVAFSKKNLKLSIIGGTDVQWSPTSNYTKYVLAEAYSRMGIRFTMDIKKRGYYPKGGGEICLRVFPAKKVKSVFLEERKTKHAKIFCSFSKIPKEKIISEIDMVKKILEENNFNVETRVVGKNALSRGGSLLISSSDSSSIIGSDGLLDLRNNQFDRKISTRFIESDLGVDRNLSDMLVVPASLTEETSVFRVNEITKHLETNLYVTSKITGCKYGIGKLKKGFEVRIVGGLDSSIQ